MTSLAVLSAAAERIDCLLLAQGAPAICPGDLRDEVVQLMSDLKSLVLSGESVEHTDHLLTQLAYAIEDSVESYAVQEAAASRRKSSGPFRQFSKRSATRKLREEIHVFRRNIDEHKHSFQVRTARMGAVKTAIASSDRPPERQLVTSSSLVNRHSYVGMDRDRINMIDLLVGGGSSSRLSIIAICGMGGLGKTTLAKLVYDDNLVAHYFHIRAWAAVSQHIQARDIIETILRSNSSSWNTDKIAGMETVELMGLLYKYLKGRRYLIVLDDVWSTEVWDSMRPCIPDDNNGSRVVITTRMTNVAAYANGRVHQMGMLTEEESWELLKIKSGLKDLGTEQNPLIEMIGKQIASQCSGLPLAITIIGGMLWGRKLEDWDSVLRRLQGFLNIDPAGEILALSYNHLPFHLKPCFLYLGLFPPDHDIPLEKLYLLWIAEGLISMTPLNNKRRMEVAEDYLKEMVNRSLVMMVEKEVVSASIRSSNSCTIHDLLRDLCISKGKQEHFLEIIDLPHGNDISPLTSKVAIDLNKFAGGNEVLVNIPESHHIRSILFFDTDESLPKPEWPREFLDLKEFHWTRVLDFDGVDFGAKNLLRGVEKLIYLRYLGFRGCYLQELPSTLSNFPFLETLDLRVRVSCTMTIPNILNKLTSLRHLYFPLSFRCDTNEKLKLDLLKKLESLENFHAGVCDADDLLQLENLQILTGFVDGNSMDLKEIINSMTANKRLSKSSLVVKKFDSYSEQRFSIVSDLLKCNSLQFLEIEGYLGKLPHHEAIGSNFTEIIFNGSEFEKDPMPILGKLPNLKSLVLCNDAFVGMKMVCSESDFLELKWLKLAALQYLEEWEVDSACLPNLTMLTIEQCDKLIELPNELVDLLQIKKFMIGSMSKGFQETVKRIIEEMMEYGYNEIEAIFYDC